MFKEDMISDGIENCVQYIHNFNPEKSQNPFAYFTQIIHYAFLRRIQREKRQLEIKNKILERSGFSVRCLMTTIPLTDRELFRL
jgi:DNA-directed RNA polymerase specialized sigma24 family protein